VAVLDIVSGATTVARQLDSPMCGRQAELTRLRAAFRRTVRSGTACRFTVVGEAGIGKSRLAKEFVESIGSDARIITGRCPTYGEGITFLPLREAVLEAAGPRGWRSLTELLEAEDDGSQVADQVAGAIGLTPQQGRAEELFAAVRRLFETLAARQSLVIVFEDLHWAEPTLLDLIEYLGRRARGRVFLLCLARPELIEQRPGWELTAPTADTLLLEPLSVADVEELIVARAGTTVQPETLRRIVETAQGNPLFAEQLLAAFNDDSVDLIPASLQGLLAMRLDRLGPGERDLLRCAENLLSRARSLLPTDHPRRPTVTQRLAEAYLVLGRHTQAQELLLELIEAAHAGGNLSSEMSARLERARIQYIIGPDPIPLGAIWREAEEAAEFYADAGDDAGQARASFLLGCVHMHAGRITAAEQAFQKSLTYADRSGQIREELATRWLLASVIVLGPAPVPECIDRCKQLAATRGTDHPGVLTELALLSAMVGRFDDARGLNEHARRILVEQMRVRRLLRFVALSNATVELLAGEIAAAEGELRTALEFARETWELDPLSQTAARLASVLRMQGRSDEAANFALLSEQAAPSESVAARALSLAAKARSTSDEVTIKQRSDSHVRRPVWYPRSYRSSAASGHMKR
jgi:tetratricopeptide (TPR) repeat protein